VLVHGNVGDRRHWDRQVPALADRFTVIRYDVRGYGLSSLPMEGTPYSEHEDLAALLDHLGTRRAHLVGWSMGASIALDFVLAYPERAESLVTVGPWVSGVSSPATQALLRDFARVSAAAVEGGPAAAARAWMEAPFFAATIRAPAAAAEFRRIAADYSFWAFTHRRQSQPLKPPAAARVREIRVPTLIMTAEHDIPACREMADLLDDTVPRSRKVVMTDTGHLMHLERPEEFNGHLTEFLAEVSSAPAPGGR
jgi:pimeloyl-ACP methyl ester carboxylesterase